MQRTPKKIQPTQPGQQQGRQQHILQQIKNNNPKEARHQQKQKSCLSQSQQQAIILPQILMHANLTPSLIKQKHREKEKGKQVFDSQSYLQITSSLQLTLTSSNNFKASFGDQFTLSQTQQIDIKQAQKDNQARESYQSKIKQTNKQSDRNLNLNSCPSCRNNKMTKLQYYSCCLVPACNQCYSGFHYLQCSKRIRSVNSNSIDLMVPNSKAQANFNNTGAFNNGQNFSTPGFISQTNKNSLINSTSSEMIRCQRCEQGIQLKHRIQASSFQTYVYSCKQCNNAVLCQQCYDSVHSSGKFKLHHSKKYQLSLLSDIKNISNDSVGTVVVSQIPSVLLCALHSKPRIYTSQSSHLLCQDCIPIFRPKFPKCLPLPSNLSSSSTPSQNLKAYFQNLSSFLTTGTQNHNIKFSSLKQSLRSQYKKIQQLLEQKYQTSINTLKNLQEYQARIISELTDLRQRIQKQLNIDYKMFGVRPEIVETRGWMLMEAFGKKIGIGNFRNQANCKIVGIQGQKIQNALKGFGVIRIKGKENEDKQNINMSMRKSIMNPNNSNLSVSRRSLSKSNTKFDNTRQSALKPRSQNISHQQQLTSQVATQPVRNATPPHSAMTVSTNSFMPVRSSMIGPSKSMINNAKVVNSSDKKSTLLRQSSILSAKLQDITPIMLNFDTNTGSSKEILGMGASNNSNASRINFISNKTLQQGIVQMGDSNISQKCSSSASGTVNNLNSININSMNMSSSGNNRKKSDYFQLRDKMRKSNLVNMNVGNRFGKR